MFSKMSTITSEITDNLFSTSGSTIDITQPIFDYDPTTGQILALIRSGERIRAINRVREVTGTTSLSDAAEIVDAIGRGKEVEL
jgi:hypothetical protein